MTIVANINYVPSLLIKSLLSQPTVFSVCDRLDRCGVKFGIINFSTRLSNCQFLLQWHLTWGTCFSTLFRLCLIIGTTKRQCEKRDWFETLECCKRMVLGVQGDRLVNDEGTVTVPRTNWLTMIEASKASQQSLEFESSRQVSQVMSNSLFFRWPMSFSIKRERTVFFLE